MSEIPTVDVIQLPVAVASYDSAIDWIKQKALLGDRAYAVEAANTHVAAMARHSRDFGQVMSQFDLVLPDGMPLVWSINHVLKSRGIASLRDRVYGPTLMLKTIQATSENRDLRHFFLGGSDETLRKLKSRFEAEHPDVQISGSYSPPFGEWPEDEFENIKSQIEASKANLVWVGLGCPKQEQWIAENKKKLPPACYFGIGAAFAFHAGEVKQAPSFYQKIGMEWLYRLVREPKRLWRRYLTYNFLFIRYVMEDGVYKAR